MEVEGIAFPALEQVAAHRRRGAHAGAVMRVGLGKLSSRDDGMPAYICLCEVECTNGKKVFVRRCWNETGAVRPAVRQKPWQSLDSALRISRTTRERRSKTIRIPDASESRLDPILSSAKRLNGSTHFHRVQSRLIVVDRLHLGL
jgi:hypothetical protein